MIEQKPKAYLVDLLMGLTKDYILAHTVEGKYVGNVHYAILYQDFYKKYDRFDEGR